VGAGLCTATYVGWPAFRVEPAPTHLGSHTALSRRAAALPQSLGASSLVHPSQFTYRRIAPRSGAPTGPRRVEPGPTHLGSLIAASRRAAALPRARQHPAFG
jgi:hypothetical protein